MLQETTRLVTVFAPVIGGRRYKNRCLRLYLATPFGVVGIRTNHCKSPFYWACPRRAMPFWRGLKEANGPSAKAVIKHLCPLSQGVPRAPDLVEEQSEGAAREVFYHLVA